MPPATVSATPAAAQRVLPARRAYNRWVGDETIEDHALRFTPRSFRKWSEWRVANTAFGAASFLILEAVGATLLVQHGFVNAALAILATGLVILLCGWPISVYAARHGVDMDLLTRGAGFGYIGSTITSLVYASFTFIFFALEAAVMAYALELVFDIPPAWGYLVCALVVLPLVAHGVTAISRLQVWTQPLWIVMLVVPYAVVLWQQPDLLPGLMQYGGDGSDTPAAFDWLAFGSATTVGIALITQMGEQADTLRFMPEPQPGKRLRWWAAVFMGGPGWVIPGVLKMLGGALLAYLVLSQMVPADRAVDPNQMYLAAYELVASLVHAPYGWAVGATALFVVISQLKINVTNAYAGSLAWSNFFSRLTHSHPGRIVWMVFNTAIALALMEMNLFSALGHVLGLYANVAIAWMMAVVADLVVNKPMGWSPPGIEFKRAHLYDINPVGVGAMGLASVLSVSAHLGAFGAMAQAFSATIALVTAFVTSPLIAWATQGRYYIARRSIPIVPLRERGGCQPLVLCGVCERAYEHDDMARCPAYQVNICSLCCTLEARCHDQCKPEARLSEQWLALLRRLLPRRMGPQLEAGLAHYLLLMTCVLPVLTVLLGALYLQGQWAIGAHTADLGPMLRQGVLNVGVGLLLVAGIVAWWIVLAQRSRFAAQGETQRQTRALLDEIESHRRTDLQLQQAKAQAEAANGAKTRYITAISHELRTPLNSILGYAQLLEEDAAMPPHRRQAVSVIRRGGDHLLGLIESTLDVARIEAGKLTLQPAPMRFADAVEDMARLIELQAQTKGVRFERCFGNLPAVVRADERRLRQTLINLLGNAVKFTATGRVGFHVRHIRDTACFDIVDTGPGMSADELKRVFEPFARGAAAGGGSGLGLTIAKMLTELMGGELTVSSTPGVGSTFSVRLFLPVSTAELPGASAERQRVGFEGAPRRLLVVDNEETDRRLMADLLQPLGFVVEGVASGEAALARLHDPLLPRPDAMFIDLAMPGIDGWETLRRLEPPATDAMPVAIVSANAFDRALDNDVGIAAADFFVKPVRRADLLDWLGARLHLHWTTSAAPSAPDRPPERRPPQAALRALRASLARGHMRGVRQQLDAIAAAHPDTAAFVERLHAHAACCEVEKLKSLLKEASHDAV